jgi:hypothetical protein
LMALAILSACAPAATEAPAAATEPPAAATEPPAPYGGARRTQTPR